MLIFVVAAGAAHSKNITFGVSDVLELVTLLDSGTAAPWAVGAASGQPGAVVRPSRWVGGGSWVGGGQRSMGPFWDARVPSAAAYHSGSALYRCPPPPSCHCRVRAMLASRACRSSIMIGKALQPRTMRLILEHLSQLESPWNCPHGRPTMRHLALLPQEAPALQ